MNDFAVSVVIMSYIEIERERAQQLGHKSPTE